MPYRYLDHQADVGILSWGTSIEEAFTDGALALFGLMAELGTVEEKGRIGFECRSREESLLFVEMLNALICEADLAGYLFRRIEEVKLTPDGDEIILSAQAVGEPFDASRHEPGIEVKAATYSGLRYEVTNGEHSLRCLLDI